MNDLANNIKRPSLDIPDYDINFEYDPDYLKQVIEDWDRQNPATVLHIEISTPDPAERMFMEGYPDRNPIRFAAQGSEKYVSERLRFITDRPIDDEKGLMAELRKDRKYTIYTKDANWIRAHYKDKLGNIIIPDTARYYAIGTNVAKRQRGENPEKSPKYPDKQRSIESIEAWNKTHRENNLGEVQGFAKFIINSLETDPMFKKFNKQHLSEFENSSRSVKERIDADDVVDLAKRALSGAFGRNKHDLYLRQELPINRRWVNQNIFIPVLRMKIKEETDYLNSDEYKEEQRKLKERRDKEAVERARETVSNYEPTPYDRGKRGIRFAPIQRRNKILPPKKRAELEREQRMRDSAERKRKKAERGRRVPKPTRGKPVRKSWFGILKMKRIKPQCANEPCLRVANGTDGIGFCMACEDDASMNRITDPKSPYTRKNQIKAYQQGKKTLPNIFVEE